MRTSAAVSASIAVLGLLAVGTGLADLNEGLVAYYPFNGNANNASGSAPDGSVSGAMLTADRFGMADSAFVFDGVDDYIEVANTGGVFDMTDSWTLACWAKPSSPATDYRDDPLIWKIAISSDELLTGDEDTFLLSWGSAGQNDVFYTGLERATDGNDFGINSGSHAAGSWRHVVGTYDGDYLNIYVDGDPLPGVG